MDLLENQQVFQRSWAAGKKREGRRERKKKWGESGKRGCSEFVLLLSESFIRLDKEKPLRKRDTEKQTERERETEGERETGIDR